MIDVRVELPREEGGGLFGRFARALKRAFGRDLAPKLQRAADEIRPWLRTQIASGLRGHDDYRRLKGGDLREQLGFGYSQQPLVEECVNYVARSAQVATLPDSDKFLGGVRVVLLSGGLEELLAQRFASYLSYGRRRGRLSEDNDFGDDAEVLWLKWLLTGGSEILVPGYWIAYAGSRSSRTGSAIMLSGSIRGGWGLPGAGTLGRNWVTDVLERVAREAGEKLLAQIGGVLR